MFLCFGGNKSSTNKLKSQSSNEYNSDSKEIDEKIKK